MEANNVIKELKFEDSADFYKFLMYDRMFSGDYIFRGECSDSFKLLPCALRSENTSFIHYAAKNGELNDDTEQNQVDCEYILLQDFLRNCDLIGLNIPHVERLKNAGWRFRDYSFLLEQERWIFEDLHECAGLAQHYGVPTRLIDWTLDAYVALYFATTGALENEYNKDFKSEYFVLWALNFFELGEPYKKQYLRFIKPVYAGNPNLCAQQGLFTLIEIDNPYQNDLPTLERPHLLAPKRQTLDEYLIKNQKNYTGKNPLLYCIKVHKDLARNIFGFLVNKMYNASRLFPGYGGAAQSVREKLLLDKKTNIFDKRTFTKSRFPKN
jgi:hypothetical protein